MKQCRQTLKGKKTSIIKVASSSLENVSRATDVTSRQITVATTTGTLPGVAVASQSSQSRLTAVKNSSNQMTA